MKIFPFSQIALCVIFPPLLYLVSAYGIENYVEKHLVKEVGKIYLGDSELLLNGSVRLEDAIHKNIESYMQKQTMKPYGLLTRVSVETKSGNLIYPGFNEIEDFPLSLQASENTAQHNYRLLNEGLVVKAEADLQPVSPASLSLIGLFSLFSIGLLYLSYSRNLKRAMADEQTTQWELDRLKGIENEAAKSLQQLESERARLVEQLKNAQKTIDNQKRRAADTEDEMITEMVALEQKLHANLALQEKQKSEIESLRTEIDKKGQAEEQERKRKTKKTAIVGKRFNTLYKSITFNERAIEGYLELTEDFRIKAEEVIHLLDRDPDKVTVKRKVFGKKNRETVFEVIFAYRGRLYFRRNASQAIEILAIGNKQTQNKDLEFLDRL